MNYTKDKISLLSNAVEYQFPSFIREDNLLFVSFLKNYYKSLESKFQPLDLVDNLIEYYNIEYFTTKNLVSSTTLTSTIGADDTTINVSSTKGFPDKDGFIQIDDEIVFYKTKTKTTFVNCTRGSSSFTFIDRSKSTLTYSNSIKALHTSGKTVKNLAYIFANEFFTRVKNELTPNIPSYVSPELNFVTVFENIKSFYLSKGSLDSVKFLFRILFNEKEVVLNLKPRGSGAIIQMSVFNGQLDKYQIFNGGSGYSNVPADYPVLEIYGSGEGGAAVVSSVTNGVITGITITDPGQNYRGAIEIVIREKQYTQEQIVTGLTTGSVGLVKYWEPSINKLTLMNLTGTFATDEYILGTTTQRNVDDNVKTQVDSYEVLPYDPKIEYPNEQLFTPSNSFYIQKNYIKCEIVSGNANSIFSGQGYYLEQTDDLDFNIKNTKIGVGIINKIYQTNEKNIVEISLEDRLSTEHFFLPPSTNLINISGTTITVDNTVGFPVENGIIQIDNEKILYTTKTVNQFLGCTRGYLSTSNVSHSGGSLIDLIGRKTSATINKFYNLKLYTSDENVVLELKLLGLPSELFFDTSNSTGLYVESVLDEQTDFTRQTTDPIYSKWRLTSSSAGVNSVYDYGDHVYVAASSIPDYSNNQSRTITNQKIVRRIPLTKKPPTTSNLDSYKNLGITNSGIEILNKSGKQLSYGSIEKFNITNFGTGYLVTQTEDTKPKIKVLSQGSEPQFIIQPTELKVNGSFISVSLQGINSDDLKNFTTKPTVYITNAVGDTTGNSAAIDCVFLNNQVKKLIVTSSGSQYIKIPTITIEGGGKNTVVTIPPENIDIRGGIFFNTTDKVTLPVSYGTSYTNNPGVVVEVTTGQGAQVSAEVLNGSITALLIGNQGTDYLIPPDIKIIGTGTNAEAKAYVSGGKLIGVEIINPGYGYIYPPVIEVVSIGEGATIDTTITDWQYNLPAILPLDNCGGYVYADTESSYIDAEFFNTAVDRSGYFNFSVKSTLETAYGITSSSHSPLIGWAYDGNPIYGRYAYTNPFNSFSGISQIVSGYELIGTIPANRPSITTYPLGSFIEDWVFNPTLSTLDKNNGRFCRTPEFPNGTYAYFATSSYPYVFGEKLQNEIDIYDTNRCRLNDSIPSHFERVKYPTDLYYPSPKNLGDTTRIKIDFLTRGSVDDIYIESPGFGYKVGESLIIDNDGTSGSGFTASIEAVKNVNVQNATNDETLKRITVTTDSPHGLESESVIHVNPNGYNTTSTFQTYTVTVSGSTVTLNGSTTTNTISTINNKKYVINITNPSPYSIYFSQDIDGKFPFYTANTIISGSSITLITVDLPAIFYVVVYNESTDSVLKTYQIFNQKEPYLGKFKINKINNTSFYYETDYSYPSTSVTNIYYSTTNRTVYGSIDKVKIYDAGSNYKILPAIVGINSENGDGAILQADSNSIGKIKKLTYQNTGDYYHSNKTVSYQIKNDAVIKVFNNLEIYEIEVLNSGFNYLAEPKIYVEGYENSTEFQFQPKVLNGKLISVDIIKSGSFLSSNPTLIVDSLSTGGSGAVVRSKVRRKSLNIGTPIYYGPSYIDPLTIYGHIISFEPNGSVLQIREDYTVGKFVKNDDYILFDQFGNRYGKIIKINRTDINFKSGYLVEGASYFANQSGFLNTDSQRLQDGKYYQKYSYVVNYNHNISDWRSDVLKNTHPVGFKLFSKYAIESYKATHEATQKTVRNILGFTLSLRGNILLKIQKYLDASAAYSTRQQILYLSGNDTTDLKEDEYIFGSTSKTLGKIISKSTSSVTVEILNKSTFIKFEYLLVIKDSYSFTTLTGTLQNNTIVCANGVLQNPLESYKIFDSKIISTYPLENSDFVVAQKLVNSTFEILSANYTDNGNRFILTNSSGAYVPASKNNLIFSVNGVVQNPTDFSLDSSAIILSEDIPSNVELFVLYSSNFAKLTVTQVNSTTYNISPSVSNKNQLLLFVNGTEQNVVDATSFTLNGGGTQLTFSESISGIFGWKLNDTITSDQLDLSYLKTYQIYGYNEIFRDKNLSYKIETNNVKNPDSYYEIERKKLNGFVYTSGTTVSGIGTKFKYSNPEYSTSYIEVLNELNSFDGITTSFKLTYLNGIDFTNSNSDSYCVNLNNSVLTQGIDYTISGSNINFINPPASGLKCTITVFASSYTSADLDPLNKSFDGSTTTFPIVRDGIPLYVYRQGDILVLRNNVLQKTSSTHYSINDDRITFVDPLQPNETLKLIHFSRLLDPVNHHNALIDDFRYFDGSTTKFATTSDGTTVTGNLLVFRNGTYQNPTSAYTNNFNSITFVDAPSAIEEIHGKCFTTNSQYLNVSRFLSFTLIISNGPNITNGMLLVFLDGVLQTYNVNTGQSFGGITYNNTTKRIIFDEDISSFTDISVLWYSQSVTTLDSINITSSSTLTYNLTLSGGSYSPANKGGLLVIVDNVVQKLTTDPLVPGSYTIGTNTITFNGITNLNVGATIRFIYFGNDMKNLDEMNETVNDVRKKFRLLSDYTNFVGSEPDLFVSVNGVIQNPISDYTVSNSYVTFDNPPALFDDVFVIGMYANENMPLTLVSGTTYQLPRNLTTVERNSLIAFYNGSAQLVNAGFTFSANNRITFDEPLDSLLGATVFAVLLNGGTPTDEVNVPFNGTRTMFTMFKNDSIFYPLDGQVSPQNLIVTKNGGILESGVEYTVNSPGSRITFTTAPLVTDKIDVKCYGSFIKLDNKTTTSGTTTYNLTRSSSAYYVNALIDRPRNYENQILAIYNKQLLSPLRDYYIENNKIVLKFNPGNSATLVLLDYRGTDPDVEVKDYYDMVLAGDQIKITGESGYRVVSSVLSPTVLTTTTSPSNLQVNFSGTANISNGMVQSITVNNSGRNYAKDTYIVPYGCGSEAICQVNVDEYGQIQTVSPIIGGYNYYVQPTLVIANSLYAINRRPLQSNQVQRLYKLQSNINNSIDNNIQLNITTNLATSPWTLTVTSAFGIGAGAILAPHISNGKVVKVTVINGGSGYDDTDIEINLTGGTTADGSGAKFEPVLNTVTGAITSVTIRNGGSGYDSYKLIVGLETIEYTQTSSGYIRGCTRGSGNTIAASHTTSEYVIFDSLL